MILIISHNFIDVPTNRLIDWLLFFKIDFIRMNGSDFSSQSKFKFDLNRNLIVNSEYKVDVEDVSCVFYRRWEINIESENHFDSYLLSGYKGEEINLLMSYKKYLDEERNVLYQGFFSLFNKKKWYPSRNLARKNINKLDVLLVAKRAGLIIPKSIVTTIKEELVEFKQRVGSVITKPISEADHFIYKDTGIVTYTTEVKEEDIDSFDAYFHPVLIQEKIEKEFEIRVFFFNSSYFSMAIFSQNDTKTKLDFRNYNREKPNRYIPFNLPSDITNKLKLVSKELGISTGSFDLLFSKDGKYYFLEVNPVGQSAMVSIACNYYFEKELAKALIKEDEEYFRTI